MECVFCSSNGRYDDFRQCGGFRRNLSHGPVKKMRLQHSEQEHTKGDVIALDDLGISVQLSSYTAVAEKDGYVYIYTGADGSIPYVIVGVYDTDAADFADQFTEYMRGEYPDLQVMEAAGTMTIKDRSFVKIIYSYEVSGYQVQDTVCSAR